MMCALKIIFECIFTIYVVGVDGKHFFNLINRRSLLKAAVYFGDAANFEQPLKFDHLLLKGYASFSDHEITRDLWFENRFVSRSSPMVSLPNETYSALH